jgi:hypothetical protein
MSIVVEDVEDEADSSSFQLSSANSSVFPVSILNAKLDAQKATVDRDSDEKHEPFLRTFTRVNQSGAQLHSLKTDNISKQIFLLNPSLTAEESKFSPWLVGANLDDLNFKKLGHKDNKAVFSDQGSVFEAIKRDLEQFFRSLCSNKLTILALGGPGAGKSFTLFGPAEEQKGIIWRFAEYAFSGEVIRGLRMITRMYMVYKEEIIDVLSPGRAFKHEDNIFHTEVTGPMVIPLNEVGATNSSQYMAAIILGLTNASYILANSGDPFSSSAAIFVSNTLVSAEEDKIWTVEFVELGVPFHFSDGMDDHCSDPFWATSKRARSVGAFADFLSAVGNEELSHAAPPLEVDRSVVTYLLADLLQGSCSGIVIGCLRADEASFSANCVTLECLSKCDELFHEKHLEHEDIPDEPDDTK